MTTALIILAVQTLLGALDNVLHHELTERLPTRPSARYELTLHSAREAIYGVLFLVFAWTAPTGVFAVAVLALLFVEVVITIADFIEEDRSRHLPAFERTLHTVLAVMYGAFLAIAVPWLIGQAASPSGVTFLSHGLLSWYFTACAVGVLAFAIRNALAVRALFRTANRLRAVVVPPSGKSVLVTGATGFIGSALTERLIARGDRVFVLTRDARQARALFDDRATYVEALSALPPETHIDAVVSLAGAPVLGLPWSEARRRDIWRSRVDAGRALAQWMATLERKPKVLVGASAIGFYGDRGDAVLDEAQTTGAGFGAELCAAREQAVAGTGARVVNLRIGIVLDPSGGALPMMALPVRFGAGAIFGDGKQWIGWITRDDLVRMIMTALDDDRWRGPVNAVAPEPIRHADFQQALARTLRRPMLFRIPAWALRAALGEMSSIFLNSQRVVPAVASSLGFTFDVHWAADAVELQLGRPPAPLPRAAKVRSNPMKPKLMPKDGETNDDHSVRPGPVAVREEGSRRAG
jgi:uncharacterized protein